MLAKSIVLLFSATGALVCGAEDYLSGQDKTGLAAKSVLCVTNVAEFRTLSGVDYLAGCDFRLTGVITLVDTNRDLLVLQDATGAVALNFRVEDQKLQVGQLVTLDGTNCCPFFASFPDYPYRPSEWNVQTTFEFPFDLDGYRLTRMRGYLHPQVTGEYRFWIASDNSSELWLSPDANPSNARKIAYIPRYGYVNPHEWSRFSSQGSEPIQLKAGGTYYIEALQEQTDGGENLSVAWQGPGLRQSVIDGHNLTPWNENSQQEDVTTNGILRESWTNYPAGSVEGMVGARPFESALTVKTVQVCIHGQGELPKPCRIGLNQPLSAENNYRWVQAEGVVKFKATDGDTVFLELSDGQTLIRVHGLYWNQEMSGQLSQLSNAIVRVEGVCEGVHDENGTTMPWLIWAPAEKNISFLEAGMTNEFTPATSQPTPVIVTTKPAVQGFFGTRGVVTFNNRVLDKDYVFVQEGNSAVLVSAGNQSLKSQLKVGRDVDLGGMLELGEYLPAISPLVAMELGWRSMPLPIAPQPGVPIPTSQEGKWSELEGVVHSVNTNGTLYLMGKNGPTYLWLGQTPSNSLANYIDAKLRARGVLMLHLMDAPMLLVPSRNFVDVTEEAPQNPFGIRRQLIAGLFSEDMESTGSRRVRVLGEITYRDAESFFIQDDSGGIRVRTSAQPAVKVGEVVEVLAFPTLNGSTPTLTEPLERPAKSIEQVKSKDLDLSEALSPRQNGTLVQVSATLLAQKTNGINQVLELQEQQRVFFATIATSQGRLPNMTPGSRLRVTGVRDDEMASSTMVGQKLLTPQFLTSLNILLRSPQDVTVLSGPPWWTWRKTASLVVMLLTILVVTLSWVHLLHRRIERQKAAQLAFSRHVLERLEDERRRIAVNLHDSLGQMLMAIKNHAILAIQRPPEVQGLQFRLDEISGATSQAIEEVRRITHGLRPYQLDRLGLTQAIRTSVNRASENSSTVFASRVEDMDGLFNKDTEIHVYRIVQEAVTNVVKHSAATEAAVVIKKRTTVITLSIRDNGRGFNPATPSSHPHDLGYGLNGIAERVRILGGTLAIESRPDQGTSLTIEIPCPNSNKA
jgi:signal transduction histidine kinase